MTPEPTGPRVLEAADPLPVRGLTLRPASPDDWVAIAEVLRRAHLADGVDEVQSAGSLRAELEPLDWFDLSRDVLLGEVDDRVVAFAMGHRVARGAALVLETWCAVAPEWRRRGIGTLLHRETRRRLADEAAADTRPGPREFRTYALDREEGDRALLAAEGYVPIRFGFEMRRWLTGELPVHVLPPALELRPVTPDQHRTIFEAESEAFLDHWGHREMTEGDFRARFDHPETDTSLWCVAWDGREVAGVVASAIYHDENHELGVRRGWLEHVSVRRPWRGRGVAKALCAASFQVLREAGMTEAWLGVDAANPTGALRLYEGLGFHVVRRWQAYGRPLEAPAEPGWRSAEDRTTGPA